MVRVINDFETEPKTENFDESCSFVTRTLRSAVKVCDSIGLICKWQYTAYLENFTVSESNLCMKLFSVGIKQHYSYSDCIFEKRGFSVSSGLVFPALSLVHTGFSLVPHGSNDPLIILYSDALIKLMCWFYVFNLPWSPRIPSVPSGSAFTLKWGSVAALITVPR